MLCCKWNETDPERTCLPLVNSLRNRYSMFSLSKGPLRFLIEGLACGGQLYLKTFSHKQLQIEFVFQIGDGLTKGRLCNVQSARCVPIPFCLDNSGEISKVDVVSMDPGLNSGFTQSVAGDPFTESLIGPSSGAWRRGPGDYGRVAYFIMDGGTASPPPSGPHNAQLIRVDLQPLPRIFPGAGA